LTNSVVAALGGVVISSGNAQSGRPSPGEDSNALHVPHVLPLLQPRPRIGSLLLRPLARK
jgi:hypothetical protein